MSTLVISDVTVIDATGAPARPHCDVLIDQERIVAIRPSGQPPASGARIIAGGGRFLIPGMWETQAHLTRYGNGILEEHDVAWSDVGDFEILDANTRSYLRHGFTSVIDLGGPEEILAGVRLRLQDGSLLGPRLLYVGRQFVATGGLPRFGDRPMTSLLVECDNPEQVEAALDRMVTLGIDAAKINHTPAMLPFGGGWPVMTRRTIAALVTLAHARGLPVLVHVDRADSAAEVLDLGVDGIEHFPEVHDRDAEADVALLTRMCLEHDAYWAPTLSFHEAFARLGDDTIFDDLHARGEILPKVLDRLLSDPQSMWNTTPPDILGYFRGRFDAAMEHIKAVHDAGVRMTVSSDSGNAGTVHGVTCRRELELMAIAGIAPMDILQIATRLAAEKFRRADDLGTLEPGKLADMVLLNGDPLHDITAVGEIELVIKGGQAYRPADVPL